MVGLDRIAGAVAGGVGHLAKPSAGMGAESPGSPFGGMMRALIDQTSELDLKAQQAVTGMLSGQGVEVHDAMIATQKADMAFELALQVRNKAVGAYQQMMAMQF